MRSGAPTTMNCAAGRTKAMDAAGYACRYPSTQPATTFARSKRSRSDVGQALFEPRRFGHSRQNGGQPRQAFLCPHHVHARIVRQRRLFQVVERTAHHGDRRAQLVRQPARHLFLVTRVVRQPRQHARETARQVADLVAGIGARECRAHAALLIDGQFRVVAQAPDARGKPRRIQRQRERADEQHGQHDVEQPLEREVALREHRVARFLDDHRALHRIADPDRMRRADDHRLRVRRGPALGGQDACQRAFDVASARRSVVRRIVGEILARLIQHERIQASRRGAPKPRAERFGGHWRRWRLERAGTRQHRAVAVDDPDARCRPRQAVDDLRDFGRRRRRQPGRNLSRRRRRVPARTPRWRRAGSRTAAAGRAARSPPPARCPRAFVPAHRAASAPVRARRKRPATAAPGTREHEQQLRAYGQRDAGQLHSAFQR